MLRLRYSLLIAAAFSGGILVWCAARLNAQAATQPSLDIRVNAKPAAFAARAPGLRVSQGVARYQQMHDKTFPPAFLPITATQPTEPGLKQTLLIEFLNTIFDLVDQFIAAIQLAMVAEAST